MKRTVLLTLAAVTSGFIALYYFGMCFQSVDYHDGAYHHIPRYRYAMSSLIAFLAAAGCWRSRRPPAPTGADRMDS